MRNHYYGHFWSEIPRTAPEKVLQLTEKFWAEWSDKEQIRERAERYAEWDKRNPSKKRRTEGWDKENDPCPESQFFQLDALGTELEWILKNL